MISWYVPQASTYAADVDNLILLIGVIVGVWFVVAEVILFWLICQVPRDATASRSQYIAGRDRRARRRGCRYPHYAVLVVRHRHSVVRRPAGLEQHQD